MRTVAAAHELLPEGLCLESMGIGTGRAGICVASGASSTRCPVCGVARPERTAATPVLSRAFLAQDPLTLEVRAGSFFCDEAS